MFGPVLKKVVAEVRGIKEAGHEYIYSSNRYEGGSGWRARTRFNAANLTR